MTLPYGGPVALAYSKYADPSMRRSHPAIVPPTVSSTSTTANNTIATKGQIAASHDETTIGMAAQNSDAQLAIAQGNALKDEVEKHTARFSKTVSSTVTNTRRLLELIREAVQKEDTSALKSVDDLWVELEQLFRAAQGTKKALPDFLEKQRNNMALYHASVVNETYHESQEELNMQAKKVNLQHGLILEHQQAFQDYKAKTANKLKDLEDLQDRVSRITLEKGHLRGEIDKYARLLEQEKAAKAEDVKKIEALRTELKTLTSSKMQLLADIEGLQKTIGDLQDKSQATEQQLNDRFITEVKEKAALLEKESEKTANLTSLVNTLKGHESNAKMEMDKVKAESRMLTEKYSRMAVEHSQAFSESKERTKRVEILTTDAERLRREGAEMKHRLEKLPELEKNNAELIREKASLLERIGTITTELNQVKENCIKVNKELATHTDRLEKIQKDHGTLKVENNKLLLEYTDLKKENKKSIQAVETASKLENDNAELRAMVDELKATQTAPAVGGVHITDKEEVALGVSMEVLQEQNIKLQGALDEWTSLAKRSYKEYKDMLPTYKQAEQIRIAAEKKDEKIKGLELQLSAARALQSNGVGTGGDATYWKNKYDGLLSSIDH